MTGKTVSVTMPDWMWGRLASIADKKHVKVGRLIEQLILAAINADAALRPPIHAEGDTGLPGRRLDILDAELKSARASGWRAPYGPRRKASA